ncbi:DUF7666 domain-containing protein [Caballeronia sp. HLA56]
MFGRIFPVNEVDKRAACSDVPLDQVLGVRFTSDTALLLRTCREDMSSSNGFVWPDVGETAQALDWAPTRRCGEGLHGWLYGHGNYYARSDHHGHWPLDSTTKWLVVEAQTDGIIVLDGKCKFSRGEVVFVGGMKEATDFIIAHEPRALSGPVIGAHVTVGQGLTATVGALGSATTGDYGVAAAGDFGSACAGDYGSAVAGMSGTATVGFKGSATAGDYAHATGGEFSEARVGDFGRATVGDGGRAMAGLSGIAESGLAGTAGAGENGQIRIRYWDPITYRYRTNVGYVGEDGLLPNVPYKLDGNFQFTAV